MFRTVSLTLYFLFQSLLFANAQPAKQWHTGEIKEALKKLNTLGTVLYIAAHPDDENTRLISYMSAERHMQTAYLSITRGDGGQNLIGNQLREQLGMIRTQELIQARNTDGGRQFFTRANDFGFSKNPDETFQKWGKEEILADVVWIIRNFKPDVIITRFNETPGTTHGHHTASAILAREAFHKAADPNAFPEQLQYVNTWAAKRLFWNTSSWFFSRNADFEEEDFIKIDVGGFNQNLGISYPEIAAKARTMHKSQAFGTGMSRGETWEYLEQWEGDKATNDPLEGLNTSWSKIKGGKEIQAAIDKMIKSVNAGNTSSVTQDLIRLSSLIAKIDDAHWKDVKTKEINELIKQVNGIYLEATIANRFLVQGKQEKVNLEITSRGTENVILKKIRMSELANDTIINSKLAKNIPFKVSSLLPVPKDFPISQPYWLKNSHDNDGIYLVEDKKDMLNPDNGHPVTAKVLLDIGGTEIQFEVPIKHKEVDYVKGELMNPAWVVPPAVINTSSPHLLFPSYRQAVVDLEIKAFDNVKGELTGKLNPDWNIDFSGTAINLKAGEEQKVSVTISPKNKQATEGVVQFMIITESGDTLQNQLELIEYDHIPRLVLLPKSEVKLVPFEFDKGIKMIGYVMGAGDKMPENLQLAGYEVELINNFNNGNTDLQKYQAIVIGVRAYNSLDNVTRMNSALFDYVQNGGTVISQYNTSYGLKTDQLAPYPLKLGRGRVTEEDSKVLWLKPEHTVMNSPNKLNAQDFDNWVQERGLYFPSEWANEFEAIIGINDSNEAMQEGSLLIAKHGNGYFVYTGLSFFRQLPEGVPGAYRLFANLLNLSDN